MNKPVSPNIGCLSVQFFYLSSENCHDITAGGLNLLHQRRSSPQNDHRILLHQDEPQLPRTERRLINNNNMDAHKWFALNADWSVIIWMLTSASLLSADWTIITWMLTRYTKNF